MAHHRSMRGRVIDMGALGAANENTIAVTAGGLSMNARGDLLGPAGQVVKKIEQIQDEQGVLNSEARQPISLADSNRMKKFALKRQFMTPEEVQANLAKLEEEKAKAKKEAQKVLTKTEMLSKDGPIITENPEEEVEPKRVKPKRTIIDSED